MVLQKTYDSFDSVSSPSASEIDEVSVPLSFDKTLSSSSDLFEVASSEPEHVINIMDKTCNPFSKKFII